MLMLAPPCRPQLVSVEEVVKLFRETYAPMLHVLDCSVRGATAVRLFTHAPIGFRTIKRIAERLRGQFSRWRVGAVCASGCCGWAIIFDNYLVGQTVIVARTHTPSRSRLRRQQYTSPAPHD